MSTSQLDRLTPGRPLTRRAVLGKALGLGAAVAAGAIAARPMLAAASGSGTYRTTSALNLRSGAGTSHPVVYVMPAGTTVQASGRVANGFREVWYQNYIGWAHADYLVPVTAGGTNPSLIGLGITTAAVNLRSGPSTGHQVLRVLAQGSLVERSGTVQNGFRYVVHQGLAGWVADAYLKATTDGPGGDPGEVPYDPNAATTTAALNLRAEPSTSARVLLVMPSGARVKLLDGYANGFRKVSYNGTVGWAATAYLN